MRHRLIVLAPVAFASVAIAGGCGADDGAAGAAVSGPAPEPAAYVAAAERLLAPAGELASAVAARVDHADAPPPDRDRLEAVVEEAGERLAELRALPLADRGLRDQRDRLTSGYAALIATMDPVVDSVAGGAPPDELDEASEGFFDALAGLATATETAR